jgi:hypothetical protein
MPGIYRVGLLVGACIAAIGCKPKQEHVFIDVPFCVTEDAGVRAQFAKQYTAIAVGDNEYWVAGLDHGSAAPSMLPALWSPKARVALIECDETPGALTGDWAGELSENSAPSLCPDQKVVFNQQVELVQNERSKALAYGGFLRFPKVELACAEGRLLQENEYTFGQIIQDFIHSVDRFHDKHEKLPATFEELAADTLIKPLPPDAWGTELIWEADPKDAPSRIRLLSSGPDKTAGNDDDIEVVSKQASGSSNIVAFYDAGQPDGVNYREWVKARAQ